MERDYFTTYYIVFHHSFIIAYSIVFHNSFYYSSYILLNLLIKGFVEGVEGDSYFTTLYLPWPSNEKYFGLLLDFGLGQISTH
jgi:hypothetical protein